MTLTMLTRLSEWSLVVIADARDSATPGRAIEAISARFGEQLSDDDKAEDPDRPGIPLWQSRPYAARRLLGEDYQIIPNRDPWQLTGPGRAAPTPNNRPCRLRWLRL